MDFYLLLFFPLHQNGKQEQSHLYSACFFFVFFFLSLFPKDKRPYYPPLFKKKICLSSWIARVTLIIYHQQQPSIISSSSTKKKNLAAPIFFHPRDCAFFSNYMVMNSCIAVGVWNLCRWSIRLQLALLLLIIRLWWYCWPLTVPLNAWPRLAPLLLIYHSALVILLATYCPAERLAETVDIEPS